jgi:subfamily B ATP-binding cassette protein MsbA
MNERIAITWQQSIFGVIVSTITILGTGLILVVGGLHVMRGQLSIGTLGVVIAYLASVYGPLSSIAHTTGQLQGAVAGARRVAMFALTPETLDAPDAVNATNIAGDITFEGVPARLPRRLRRCSTTSPSGEARRWWRWSASPAPGVLHARET